MSLGLYLIKDVFGDVNMERLFLYKYKYPWDYTQLHAGDRVCHEEGYVVATDSKTAVQKIIASHDGKGKAWVMHIESDVIVTLPAVYTIKEVDNWNTRQQRDD